MGQLSFFSADVSEPTVTDLGGLLAAHGQAVVGSVGCRLSILVSEPWRAAAVEQEFARRGLSCEVVERNLTPDEPEARAAGALLRGHLVRSERSRSLAPLVADWTRGAVKAVPAFPIPAGGFLRCWAVAAGRPDGNGFLLGADAHASQTYPRLAAGLSAIGLTGSVVGSRGGGPGIRIVGRRRLDRLAELLGDPPPGAPPGSFPDGR